jgi:hypothetical protein
MVLLASLSGTVTIDADTDTTLLGYVEITEPVDTFDLELTLDALPFIAAAQRFQRLGVRVRVDRGDGVMLTMPDAAVGDALVIDESADNYGDRLEFRLAGSKFSPFSRGLLRSMARVLVYFTYGSPRNEYSAQVFEGYLIAAPFDVQAPNASVTALDASAQFVETRAKDYTLAPDSGKSRLAVTRELLTLGGFPIGALEFIGDGGTVNKPFTLGDRTILDFLRDYLAILDLEIGFENGLFVARRYDAELPPVAELTPAQLIAGAALDTPGALSPNILGVVAVSSTRKEPSGFRTEEESVITTGPYAPVQYATEQDDGDLTENPGGSVEAIRTISEVTTRTTYFGSLDLMTEETEKGWYAERAAGGILNGTGGSESEDYEVTAIPGTVFIFPDGSTRSRYQEIYQVTRHMRRVKTLDDDNNVVGVREERSYFRFFRAAPFTVELLSGELRDIPAGSVGPAMPINDEGHGVEFQAEQFGTPGGTIDGAPSELTVTTFTLNDDGTIREEKTEEGFHDLVSAIRRQNDAHGFGIDNRVYLNTSTERNTSGDPDDFLPFRGRRTTVKRYRQLDEDRYTITESVSVRGGPPTVKTSTITGSLPRPERADAETTSQEIRATVRDEERIALAGIEIEDIEQNEFIETDEEARFYAAVRARRASAITLRAEMAIEALIHKWKMLTVRIPGASIDGLKFWVRSVRRDAATFRQSIVAEYYPPDIEP